MIQAFRAHDLPAAQSYSAQVVRSVEILIKYGGQRAGKAIMSLVDLPLGPPRLPLRPLSPTELTALRSDLDAMNFFSLIAP